MTDIAEAAAPPRSVGPERPGGQGLVTSAKCWKSEMA